MRYFKNKEVELLAPVGTFEGFKQIVNSKCDALYLGGQDLNMRMLRQGYNFTNVEIEEAVKIAHNLDKKVFVTVNNLISQEELSKAHEFLGFLDKANVDAVIVQDMALLKYINENKLNYDIHASVTLNTHNIETTKALKENRVCRIVPSTTIDLKTMKYIQEVTGIEVEAFIHGHLCHAQGPSCYYSSMLFGMSRLRGRCLKPCMWDYNIKKDGNIYPTTYPLVTKDVSLYEYIPELIENNVMSFKVEGRMKDPNHITEIVNLYGDAIDRYLEDPLKYDRKKDYDKLTQFGTKIYSAGFAFENPGNDYFTNKKDEKIFSNSTQMHGLKEHRVEKVNERLREIKKVNNREAKLAVKVSTAKQAKVAIENNVDRLYISLEHFNNDSGVGVKDIIDLCKNKKSTKIYLAMPRMMDELDFDNTEHALKSLEEYVDGIVATNIGAINKFKEHEVVCDFPMNALNSESYEFFKQQGSDIITLPIDTNLDDLCDLLSNIDGNTEMVVHGLVSIIYSDINLYEIINNIEPSGKEDNKYLPNDILTFKSEKEECGAYLDQKNKTHLVNSKEICLYYILESLYNNGVNGFRIEGMFYDEEHLDKVIDKYKIAMNCLNERTKLEEFDIKPLHGEYTMSSLNFNKPNKYFMNVKKLQENL